MSKLTSVFISHSHADERLARAFKETLGEIFAEVDVKYSSDKALGGGVQSGANWLDWIYEQVLNCQEALVLLTPYSTGKPWPMWEAGAVSGVAMATLSKENAGDEQEQPLKGVTPVYFRLQQSDLPGPFVVTQAVNGESEAHLGQLLGEWMDRYSDYSKPAIDTLVSKYVPELKEKIDSALEDTPAPVSDELVTEWVHRLEQAKQKGLSSQVKHLHAWIELMFEGPRRKTDDGTLWSQGKTHPTWDLRLHLRLGELYLEAGQKEPGIEQYELASRLAPLDIFVLHQLANALLRNEQPDRARRVMDRILELDPEAKTWNPEVAGLEGRYWKDEGDRLESAGKNAQAREAFFRARDAYQAVLNTDENSYYMADNVGQMSFKLQDREGWEKAYEIAKRALENEEDNTWSLATRATAALALGSEDEALAYLARIPDLEENPDNLSTIERGLKVVQQGMGKDAGSYKRWVSALRETES